MAAGELLTDAGAGSVVGPRRAAVLGRPVAHSLSPALHRAAYTALGLTGWRYDAVDVGVDGLADLVAGLDAGWAGLSVTMPLKQAITPLLDDVTPLALAVGAVNTVVVEDGERVRLLGDNTDVAGIVGALGEAGVASVARGVVLGGGATAASALAALADLGCRDPRVVVRSPARATAVTEAAIRLGCEPQLVAWSGSGGQDVVRDADVVVSTVPAGAADGLADALPDRLTGVLLDVVYAPWPTALARSWDAAGGRAVDGLEMLLHQAAVQVRLFTGRPAPLEAMRRVAREARSGEVRAGSAPEVK